MNDKEQPVLEQAHVDNHSPTEATTDMVGYESHSDDEEWEEYAKLPQPPKFTFYQYGFSSISDSLHSVADSFHHLGSSISEGWNKLHENYNNLSSEYATAKDRRRSPSPTNNLKLNTSELNIHNRKVPNQSVSSNRTKKNIFDVRDFQKTQEREKLTTSTKISRFRPKSPTWDGSFFISKNVQEQLYRVPCRDPTGKTIFSLDREQAKGVPAWKTPNSGKDLDPPSFTSCSESYQRMVLRFMDEVIDKVEREYRSMPENSQAKVNLKARAGADLNNLKQERERLLRDLALFQEQEGKHSTSPQRGRSNQKDTPHNRTTDPIIQS